jgi:hypothetical protein
MNRESVILLASVVTPLASAAATLIPVLVTTFKNRRTVVEKLDLVIRDMARLTMHDEYLPLEERIAAGDRYTETGGNGASKVYLQDLIDKYRDRLKNEGIK